jgi:glutamate dehydrogenase
VSAHGEQAQAEKLIEATVALAKGQDEAAFSRLFFGAVPPRDLNGRDPQDLHAAAGHIRKTAATRMPGAPKIGIGNPTRKGARMGAAHTVVEIINEDMPFLVDSVTGELNRLGLTVHLVIHPIMRVRRDADGTLKKVYDPADAPADALVESWMRIEVDLHTANVILAAINAGLSKVLSDVRAAVEDWPRMLEKVHDAAAQISVNPPALAAEDLEEGRAFLTWMADENFTFLGYREYEIIGSGDGAQMTVVEDSGLGVLRDPNFHVFEGVHEIANLPPEVRDFLEQPTLLVINKSNVRSTVHRTSHMDAVGVKLFDTDGKVVGERLYVGLFTSIVYAQSPVNIPQLRLKIARAMAKAQFPPSSHDAKALQHIFHNYPRDELFQISVDDLYRIGMGILHLQERQHIALFARHDSFQRFVSCLVFVPRERYTTDMRAVFTEILQQDFGGPVTAFYIQIGDDSVLARIHFIIKTDPSKPVYRDIAATEAKLMEAGRGWADKLRDALVEAHGEETGLKLLHRYANVFPAGYRDSMRAAAAVVDIAHIETALATGALQLNFHAAESASAGSAATGKRYQFRMYNPGAPMPLSDVLPVLEDMGLRVVEEVPYEVAAPGGTVLWIHDFGVLLSHDAAIDPVTVREDFHEAFARTWRGEMESDGFNALVLDAGLNWREIVILRAYAKYLRQIGAPFSPEYVQETFQLNPSLARLVIDLFLDRFRGDGPAKAKTTAKIEAKIAKQLDAVTSLDQDRIVRWFVNLVRSTLRTNFRQTMADGAPKPYVSFKLDSEAVDDLPLPRPMVEIWVYSPRFEGVHLRFGKVARGGLRWSDRREDFRTEILGLVKAQVVKNAVIVPVGSKGGFVLKAPPKDGGRDALQAEGIACYKMFIAGMLDLTDNIQGDTIAPPPDVTRYDDDDPYLVVAADKGTATFSDIANGVSQDYGFWLDDAFASGGSAGYDHKVMGITARGAWEAVKRHFREMGHDTQSEEFTVIGVGDMSGDVFGNGMLLSEHIRLIAAFNHLHIFVDPHPDAAAGFRERKRLFALPRSSWSDYDPAAISAGGGVFDRTVKSIDVSAEMKAAFDIDKDKVTPNELIRHILRARADLLWFGGIGTYVKAASESDADVGDRANDAIRISGKEVRARVVGEGANLGLTQLGRVEYAQHGGRLNTDAIDNSAGVDCSDHEVNIKILLGSVVQRGDMTLKRRNALLEAMTDEVADLVLRDNYLQTAAISVTESLGRKTMDRLTRFMRDQERAGILNRSVEFLPDEEALEARGTANQALSRPELSVLLAYAKIELFDKLLSSDLPDDPYFADDLLRYFPSALRKKYRAEIDCHRLRREIVATSATNSAINRAGITFAHDLEVETGMPAADIVRAYVIVRDAFDLRDLWQRIEALDAQVDAQAQNQALLHTGRLIRRAVEWFLRNAERPLDIAKTVAAFQGDLRKYAAALPSLLPQRALENVEIRRAARVEAGFPEDLAKTLALQPLMLPGCTVVQLMNETGQPLAAIGSLFFAVGERFSLPWLRDIAYNSAPDEYWDKLAAYAVIDDLYGHQYEMTKRILARNGKPSVKEIDRWVADRQPLVGMLDRMIEEMRAAGQADIAMLAVATRHMRTLLGA